MAIEIGDEVLICEDEDLEPFSGNVGVVINLAGDCYEVEVDCEKHRRTGVFFRDELEAI